MDAELPDPQELHELRRRVYGPSPDLEHDPAAHARLAALESARASAIAAGGGPADADERPVAARAGEALSEPELDPDPGLDPDPDPGLDPDSLPEEPSPIGRLLARLTPRSTRTLQVAALILALAVTAATTAWITREPGRAVADLPLSSDVENNLGQIGSSDDGTVTSAEFHGLTLSRLPGNTSEQQLDDDCLTMQTTDTDPASVVGAYGCGAGEVPARIPINVTDDLPAELRDVFPVGTTLVFVLGDDVVRVRAITG